MGASLGRSSNGKTADSGSAYRGSSPCLPANHAMKFFKFFLSSLWCLAAFGQDAPPPADTPPPEVDQALRARVTQFYSANISGKWRDAFQVVADDMQNEYLAASKEKYDSCETVKISYSDNFTKASVLEKCRGEYRWRNSQLPFNAPLSSTWKVVDGQWYWYFLKPTEMMTPFGLSTIKPDTPGPDGTTVSGKIETVVKDPRSMAKEILGQIKVDKKEIRLRGYETSSEELHISNGMDGTVSVTITSPPVPGFRIKQPSVDIGPKQTSAIVFEYDADEAQKQCGECSKRAKPFLIATVRVDPTAQLFSVKITFAIPPELEKQLPKELRQPPQQ
jgi:hypothetical protein